MAEKPEDLNLPTSVVTKIIKDSLPSHVKVSKEANVAIAKSASVFVLYATSCSNNVAMKANRKTIHGNDVISAMADMEFEKFVKPLETSLELWKKSQQKKKDTKEAAKKKADTDKDRKTETPSAEMENGEDDAKPPTQLAEENKENEDDED